MFYQGFGKALQGFKGMFSHALLGDLGIRGGVDRVTANRVYGFVWGPSRKVWHLRDL